MVQGGDRAGGPRHGEEKALPGLPCRREGHLKAATRSAFPTPALEEVHRPPGPSYRLRQLLLFPADAIYRQKVWVKGTYKTVEVFPDHERIKMHTRAALPGTFMTDHADYPPDKLAYLMATPTWCRKKAAEYGPHTAQLINAVLEEHAMRNLRKAQAILRLAGRYPDIIEKVAERALTYGNVRYKAIKAMLEKELTGTHPAIAAAPLPELGKSFLRPPDSFKGVMP